MLAVIRHGDRTPKQKMKMKVTQVREVFWCPGAGQVKGNAGLVLPRPFVPVTVSPEMSSKASMMLCYSEFRI